MLAERHTTPESNPVDAMARACISKGYTRGWLPGAEFEG
ncbi:hypothetical protein ACVINH_000225 [Rhizobium anhuiense]|jgi:hypothetical protein